jgi:hypothetical protein
MNAGANEDADGTDVTHLLTEPIAIDSPEKGSDMNLRAEPQGLEAPIFHL